MDANKRKTLEAAGWKIGGASEFLGLSPEESAYIELKLTLSNALRERRKQQRLTQVELAARLKSSQSRVAKMEAGDPSVSLDLLVRSLLTTGITPRGLAQIIAPSAICTSQPATLIHESGPEYEVEQIDTFTLDSLPIEQGF